MVPAQFVFCGFILAGFLLGLLIRESLSKKGKNERLVTLCTVLFVLPVVSLSWGLVKGGFTYHVNIGFLFYSGFLFIFFMLSGFFFRVGIFFLLLYACFYFWGCWVLDGFSSESKGECIEITVASEGERPVIEQIRTFPCGITWGTVFFRPEKSVQNSSLKRSGLYDKSKELFIRIQDFFRIVDLKLSGEEKGRTFEIVYSDPPVQSFYPACFRIYKEKDGFVMVPVPYY